MVLIYTIVVFVCSYVVAWIICESFSIVGLLKKTGSTTYSYEESAFHKILIRGTKPFIDGLISFLNQKTPSFQDVFLWKDKYESLDKEILQIQEENYSVSSIERLNYQASKRMYR